MSTDPSVSLELCVVGAAILAGDRCLATQRGSKMSLPHRWEFPGGKVKEGESLETALRRELKEELGVEIEVGRFLARGDAVHGRRRIHLSVYLARLSDDKPLRLREHEDHGWFTAEELMGLDWADADVPIVPLVCEVLRGGREDGQGRRLSRSDAPEASDVERRTESP